MELKKIIPVLLIPLALLTLYGCDSKESAGPAIVYEGPLLEWDSVRILHSDSAVVRVVVEAPKQYLFEDEDQEFPEGIFIRFFEPDGTVSSTLKADHGYSFGKEKRYTGVGNVVVKKMQDKSTVLTDTLHWDQIEGKIYTKAHVTIIEETDTLRGQGLEAAQDLSTYTILKSEGSRTIKDSPADTTAIDNNEPD